MARATRLACSLLTALTATIAAKASPFATLPPGTPAPYVIQWVNVHEAAHSSAHAVSNRGVIAGDWSLADSASSAGVLHSTSALQTLLPPPHPHRSIGIRHLNSAGDTVGFIDNSAFLRRNGSLSLLTPPAASVACARGINDNGTVVGDAVTPGGPVAWHWHPTTGFTSLAGLENRTGHGASGINNAGTIIGWSSRPSAPDPTVIETTPWILTNGVFSPFSWQGTSASSLTAINDHGDLLVEFRMAATGTRNRFAVRSGSSFHEILFTLPAGMSHVSVRGLNHLGEIAGFCLDANGQRHAFRGLPAWLPEITDSHTDLTLRINSGQLTMEVNDTDFGQSFASDRVVIRAGPSARRLVPPSPSFAFLGPTGSSTWILPQAQDYALPWLGISSFIPQGILAGNQAHLTLEEFSGPGNFQLYSISGLGTPIVRINTADGLNPATDRLSLGSGAHAHFNWAFSAPGLWNLRFRVRASPAAGGPEIVSTLKELTFLIDKGNVFPIRLRNPQIDPSGIRLTLETEVGRELILRSSSDLVHWHITRRLITTDPVTTLTEPIDGPRRFHQPVLR